MGQKMVLMCRKISLNLKLYMDRMKLMRENQLIHYMMLWMMMWTGIKAQTLYQSLHPSIQKMKTNFLTFQILIISKIFLKMTQFPGQTQTTGPGTDQPG